MQQASDQVEGQVSDIESMLEDACRRFLDERHPVARARDAAGNPASASALWAELAALGWPALLLPESAGGMGLGLAAAWPLAHQAGRHLLTVPLVANMALLPMLCAARLATTALADWLAPVLAGDTCYAPAAARADGSLRIEYAAPAWHALVLRRSTPGNLCLERHDLAQAAIATGLDPTIGTACISGATPLHRLDIELDEPAWVRVQQGYRLLRSAEMLGAASAALDAAAAHARERQQFGRPIGANQAIKHRLADDWMALDDAGLAGRAAAQSLDGRDMQATARACAVAELLAWESAQRAAQNAIQVHGALGIAWECDMHLYLKRVLHIGAMLDSAHRQGQLLDTLWDQVGDDDPEPGQVACAAYA